MSPATRNIALLLVIPPWTQLPDPHLRLRVSVSPMAWINNFLMNIGPIGEPQLLHTPIAVYIVASFMPHSPLHGLCRSTLIWSSTTIAWLEAASRSTCQARAGRPSSR